MIIIWNAYVKKSVYNIYYIHSTGWEKKRDAHFFTHSSNFSHIWANESMHANHNCHEDVKGVNNNVEQAFPCMMQTQLSPSVPLAQPHWSGISEKCIIWQFLVSVDVVGAIVGYVTFFCGWVEKECNFFENGVTWIIAFYPVELAQIHHLII